MYAIQKRLFVAVAALTCFQVVASVPITQQNDLSTPPVLSSSNTDIPHSDLTARDGTYNDLDAADSPERTSSAPLLLLTKRATYEELAQQYREKLASASDATKKYMEIKNQGQNSGHWRDTDVERLAEIKRDASGTELQMIRQLSGLHDDMKDAAEGYRRLNKAAPW